MPLPCVFLSLPPAALEHEGNFIVGAAAADVDADAERDAGGVAAAAPLRFLHGKSDIAAPSSNAVEADAVAVAADDDAEEEDEVEEDNVVKVLEVDRDVVVAAVAAAVVVLRCLRALAACVAATPCSQAVGFLSCFCSTALTIRMVPLCTLFCRPSLPRRQSALF